jgi:hypothetical protein
MIQFMAPSANPYVVTSIERTDIIIIIIIISSSSSSSSSINSINSSNLISSLGWTKWFFSRPNLFRSQQTGREKTMVVQR